ncbi:MAG: TIGR01777 family oxidoreductase [Opitutae bacterium]
MSSSFSQPKVILAGGTGFLGQLLAQSFAKDGYEVVLLSRNCSPPPANGRIVVWNAKTMGKWAEELEGAEVLINLTGRSIDCRHTASNRIDILNSRVHATRVLGEAMSSCNRPPKAWFNASSMALYGQSFGNEPAHNENSPIHTTGFLEEVTVAWEKEFFKCKMDGVRQVALRISFILGRASGAFPLLNRLARIGLGGTQGSGDQWMSWLHEDDWIGIIRFLCQQDQVEGAINLCSSNPVTNIQFMKTLREIVAPLGIGLPAPSWGVRLGCALLGSASELALQSRRVVSVVLKEQNFQFQFPLLKDALTSLAVQRNA